MGSETGTAALRPCAVRLNKVAKVICGPQTCSANCRKLENARIAFAPQKKRRPFKHTSLKEPPQSSARPVRLLAGRAAAGHR